MLINSHEAPELWQQRLNLAGPVLILPATEEVEDRAELPFAGSACAGAAARLVEQSAPAPAPGWVTVVPAADRPEVAAFAASLADALGLAFAPVVVPARAKAPQAGRENSAQQVLNVLGAFAVDDEVSDGPVLLVDDTVSSRWTLTVVGSLLAEHGAGPVFPLVLARR